MSPTAVPANPATSFVPVFAPILEQLRTAPTAPDAKGAADTLAHTVQSQGLKSLSDFGVLKTLDAFSVNKKSGYERESGAVGYHSLAAILGPPVQPLLLPSLPVLLDLYSDKGDVVRSAALGAVKAITSLTPVEGIQPVMERYAAELKANSKWKSKIGCLKEMARLVDLRGAEGKEEVANLLGTILPWVEESMHDTKSEVSSQAVKTATTLCGTLPNPDLVPHIPILISAMQSPANVPQTIKALSNTTFVSEVTAPSLAILVPLLTRALNDRSMEVQRRTVIVVENMCKLVRNKAVAARYLSPLVDGVAKIMTGASFPEVRAFAASAHTTLLAAGASAEFKPPPPRNLDDEAQEVLDAISPLLPSDVVIPSPNDPSSPGTPVHPLFAKSLAFSARLVAELVYRRAFTEADAPKWKRSIGVYLTPWLKEGTSQSEEVAEAARKHFLAIELAKSAPAQSEDEDVLVNTLFSLAYGALLLLSHTTLRLVRGRRYGICAANGMGKSTLLRAIRDGKVENFPSQDELRAIMVEHALQGEDRSLPIIDFIASDEKLKDVPRKKIREQLIEVGFDDERQAQEVGSLSGGWKMKLELARAMLYKADLLLLDEPTNHLDVPSVKWLQDYLLSQKNVTCLIVSHDSGFLDTVTTDIIHYESKKLVYYPGNLSAFVAKVPSAQSYYTLAATT
ncbi:hypothetical protein FRC03_005950, partial [Tulasnella sp. 419]